MNKIRKKATKRVDKFISKLDNLKVRPDLFKKEVIGFLQETLKHPEDYITKIQNIEFIPPGTAPTRDAINDKYRLGCKNAKEILTDLRKQILSDEVEIIMFAKKNILSHLTNLELFKGALIIISSIISASFWFGYNYRDVKYDKEKFQIQKELNKQISNNHILKEKTDSLLNIINNWKINLNAQLPTKNIVHLADSAKNEGDRNK